MHAWHAGEHAPGRPTLSRAARAWRKRRGNTETSIFFSGPGSRIRFEAAAGRSSVILGKATLDRTLLGDRPLAILCFVTPTLVAVACDLVLRPRSLLAFAPRQWLNYFGSSLASAGLLGRAALARLAALPARRSPWRDGRPRAFFGALRLPARDLLLRRAAPLLPRLPRLHGARHRAPRHRAARDARGVARARGAASIVVMVARRAWRRRRSSSRPLARPRGAARGALRSLLPVVGFGVAAYCFWVDFVESRSLQAAPPDTCFIHGVVHALRDGGHATRGGCAAGISLREPAAAAPARAARAPPERAAHRHRERARRRDVLGAVPRVQGALPRRGRARPRSPLGRLTSQSSGTFTSCVDAVDRPRRPTPTSRRCTSAPGALGGRARPRATARRTSARRTSATTTSAPSSSAPAIDVKASAVDLGDAGDPHIGAPDENATARMLDVRARPSPRRARRTSPSLHLSNTHWPYRVDPDAPALRAARRVADRRRRSSAQPLPEQRAHAGAHGRRASCGALRAMPGWDDTVVLFVSDHGEQFREHGGLYHLSSLFDEQVRVPGWLVAGDHALDARRARGAHGVGTRAARTRRT